eukprot:m.41287 g.41287  ORF g.41287 m.41287 type:complete len:459 (+) comp46134_c0_seq9:86-1462(+)
MEADEWQPLLPGDPTSLIVLPAPWLVRISLFLCGMGIFARTEAFLLQTQLYNVCFNEGLHFYAKANAALFLPGLAVLFLQSKCDHVIDLRFGTLRANYVRIVFTTALTIIVTEGYILLIDMHPSLSSSSGLIYSTLLIVGLCTSLVYGAFAQIVALVPDRYHSYFFIGQMCPFFVLLPVNIATGNLCSVSMQPSDKQVLTTINWSGVLIFYGAGSGLTVLAVVALRIVTHACRDYIRRKDLLLSTQISASINDEEPKEATPLLVIFSQIKYELVTYGLSVLASIYVASKYSAIPSSHFANLETLLLYEYYVASAFGMISTEFKIFRNVNTALLFGVPHPAPEFSLISHILPLVPCRHHVPAPACHSGRCLGLESCGKGASCERLDSLGRQCTLHADGRVPVYDLVLQSDFQVPRRAYQVASVHCHQSCVLRQHVVVDRDCAGDVAVDCCSCWMVLCWT